MAHGAAEPIKMNCQHVRRLANVVVASFASMNTPWEVIGLHSRVLTSAPSWRSFLTVSQGDVTARPVEGRDELVQRSALDPCNDGIFPIILN
jgi:hypothetical protein